MPEKLSLLIFNLHVKRLWNAVYQKLLKYLIYFHLKKPNSGIKESIKIMFLCTCYWTGIHKGVVAVIFSILTSVSWDFLIAPGVRVECPRGARTWGFVYVNTWIRVLNTLLVKAEQVLLQVETKCTANKKYWIKKGDLDQYGKH